MVFTNTQVKSHSSGDAQRVIYKAPHAGRLRILKIVSLTSLAVACSFAPTIVFSDADATVKPVGKAMMGAAFIMTSGASTLALAMLTRTYATRIRALLSVTAASISAATPLVFETISAFGRLVETRTTVGALAACFESPLATWEATGAPRRRRFFVQVPPGDDDISATATTAGADDADALLRRVDKLVRRSHLL